jgi:hypothetical protein
MNTINDNRRKCAYIVEFLGPSGSGKTTLSNIIASTLGDEWKYNLSYCLVETPFRNKYESIENVYKLLFEKKLVEFIKNQSLYHLPELARYFAIRLQRDLWMLNVECKRDRFMSDEGLFHYYMHDIFCFLNEGGITEDDFRIIVENRLVLNLVQTKENIIKNLTARSLEMPGANNDHVGKFSTPEVEHQIDSYLDTSNKIIQKIRSMSGLVIDVNLDRPIDIVIKEIKSYL